MGLCCMNIHFPVPEKIILFHPLPVEAYRLCRYLHRFSDVRVVGVLSDPAQAGGLLAGLGVDTVLCAAKVLPGIEKKADGRWLSVPANGLEPAWLKKVARALGATAADDPGKLDRRLFFGQMTYESQVELRGEFFAEVSELPEADLAAVWDRVEHLQGPSPWDDAWPTEDGHEPERRPGWNAEGTFMPMVLNQVYGELKAAGKLPAI